MARTTTYNQNDVNFTFNGQLVTDFAEDDTIEVAYPDEIASVEQGTDRAATSIANKTTGTITVHVKPQSSFIDTINQYVIDQKVGAVGTTTAALVTGVGEIISFSGISVRHAGSISTGGPKWVKRSVEFNYENYQVGGVS